MQPASLHHSKFAGILHHFIPAQHPFVEVVLTRRTWVFEIGRQLGEMFRPIIAGYENLGSFRPVLAVYLFIVNNGFTGSKHSFPYFASLAIAIAFDLHLSPSQFIDSILYLFEHQKA